MKRTQHLGVICGERSFKDSTPIHHIRNSGLYIRRQAIDEMCNVVELIPQAGAGRTIDQNH